MRHLPTATVAALMPADAEAAASAVTGGTVCATVRLARSMFGVALVVTFAE